MLNLSKQNPITENLTQFSTVKNLSNRPHYKILNKIIFGVTFIALILLLLPWTQNISGSGSVTTLKPDQRPQTIHSAIAGRIEKWYVNEGDSVRKGDTILFISEVKEEYLDPNIIQNTKSQMEAKKMSELSYGGKVKSLSAQIDAIKNENKLKLQQARNKILQLILKVKSDSVDLIAVRTQIKIATTQFNRSLTLNNEGLKPLSDVEEKRLKLQELEAKIITQENKYLSSKNELINVNVEVNRIAAEYAEKDSKTRSEQYTALSSQYDTKAQVSKLQNQYANYQIRNGMYYIKAPQNGYVNRAIQSGIGETIKEGTEIVSIMPSRYDVAVETYVSPNDLPLIKKGAKVRIWFDGWPSVVFSGWPDISYGTFGGKIVAIENFISSNGKFRVLIAPDATEAKWPKQISMGSGAQMLALLDNVPVWFEIWRNLNGFPPNYYKAEAQQNNAKK